MSIYLGDAKVGVSHIVKQQASTELVPIAVRPDAEVIQRYEADDYVNADLGVEIPEYSTSAKTLVAAANLKPTITVDTDNYSYLIAERFLTIPEYSVETLAKGREEYQFSSYIYEIGDIEPNSMHSLIGNKTITARNISYPVKSLIRSIYWSSSSAIAVYTATSYGVAQVVAAPAISSNTLTVKAPSISLRGHATYFTSTFYNALTDIRRQYVIEVYRAPKNNLNVDGWDCSQQLNHIVSCVNTINHKLT